MTTGWFVCARVPLPVSLDSVATEFAVSVAGPLVLDSVSRVRG